MKRSGLVRLLAGAVLLAIPVSSAWAQTGSGPDAVAQQAMPVTLPAGEGSVVGAVLDFAPGAGIPEHTHGGPVVATVLSGTITINDSGTATHYSAGQGWTEMPGHVHSAVNEGSSTARVAVAAVLAKGADLTTLTPEGAKQTGGTGPTVPFQAAYPITISAGEYNLIGLTLNFAPGSGIPDHVHGGPVLAQVLSGAITLNDDAGTKVYNTGDMWTETGGHVHNASNKGSASTEVFVAALIPKGSELQTLVNQPSTMPVGMPATGGGAETWPLWGALLAGLALLVGGSLRRKVGPITGR